MASKHQTMEDVDQELEVEPGKNEPSPFKVALQQAADAATSIEEAQLDEAEKGVKIKELIQHSHPETGLIFFKYEGGGELPAMLSGQYTSKKQADQAKEIYLASRRKRKES